LERLKVGVDGDELDSLDARFDHPVDGIDAGTTDADHAQDGLVDRAACDHRLVARTVLGLRLLGGLPGLFALARRTVVLALLGRLDVSALEECRERSLAHACSLTACH